MVFIGAHVVCLMAFDYCVHGELIAYLKATLQCFVIEFTMLIIYSQRLPYGVWLSSAHRVCYPLMDTTLLCLVVPMVYFKPNVYGVNYPFLFFLLII
jgi:hypothetical protein